MLALSVTKARGDEQYAMRNLESSCADITGNDQEKLIEQNSVFYHSIVECIAVKNKADFKGIGATMIHTKDFQRLKICALLEGFIKEYDDYDKQLLSDIGQSGGSFQFSLDEDGEKIDTNPLNSTNPLNNYSGTYRKSVGAAGEKIDTNPYNYNLPKTKEEKQEVKEWVNRFKTLLEKAVNNPNDNRYYKEMVNILNGLQGSEVYSVTLMQLLNNPVYSHVKDLFYESHKNSYFMNCIRRSVMLKNLADYPRGMTDITREYQHKKIKCILRFICDTKLGSIGLVQMTASAVNAVGSLALKSLRGIGRAITDPLGSLKRAYKSTQKANRTQKDTQEATQEADSKSRDVQYIPLTSDIINNQNSPTYNTHNDTLNEETAVAYVGGRRRRRRRTIKRKSTRRIKRKSIKSRKHSKGTK
jgi:hypothetical protein